MPKLQHSPASAVLLIATLALPLLAHAAPSGGADAPAAAPQPVTLGSMTWSFYDAEAVKTYPTESAQVADSMKAAINNYNTIAAYDGNVPVSYANWDGLTAQASYQNSIQFGYMRSTRTAQHELAHFMGMQPWVSGGKAYWGDLCDANGWWQGPVGKARMTSFKPGDAPACSGGNGHFADFGLNWDNEFNWLSKGRNIFMVGALRADIGLTDGSSLPEKAYRLISRTTGASLGDSTLVESGNVIEAVSTQSARQVWLMTLDGGYMRLKNQASQRVLDGGGTAPVLLSVPGSVSSSTWEMIPTDSGYFMLRNQQSNKCLKSAGSGTGAPLQLADCDTTDAPPAGFQFSLASPPPAGTAMGYVLPLPPDAVDCAAEWQSCKTPDSRPYTVYFGANGIYTVLKGVLGSVSCDYITLGDPLPGKTKRCFRSVAAVTPTLCATEGQSCKLPNSASYAAYFGFNGAYVLRKGLTGSFGCDTTTFGSDPAQWQTKHCFWLAESALNVPLVNTAPTVSLTAPANNTTFTQGSVITFAANATDADGNVARVDLYDNGNLIGTSTVSPYRWTWGSAAVGKHVFTAKATDNQGASATSAGVNVTVNAPTTTPSAGAMKCANQNSICVLPAGKTATVWFGALGAYKVRAGLSGNVACNTATFGGDPIWFASKACYYVTN